MERQALLSLTTEINNAFRVKFKAKDVLVVGSELSLGEGLEQSVEKEQKFVLRIVRHDNKEGDDAVEDWVNLLISLWFSLR